MVRVTNPGSVINIDHEDGRFKRLFLCFNACQEGFISGCRPLLFLDGTFLKDRYKGILLGAMAYDGNHGIFPLALSVCDSENEENWCWFIQRLWSVLYDRREPYAPPHPLVIISDADKGIKEAVKRIFPNALHSRCVLHLVENYKHKLRDIGLPLKLCQELAKTLQDSAYAYTAGQFHVKFNEIRKQNPQAYAAAIRFEPECWANAFFAGIRYTTTLQVSWLTLLLIGYPYS